MAAVILFLATLAGAVAAVGGFGIGSVLTPTFSLVVDIKVAVAAASIPHLVGSTVRCWSLRSHIDRGLLWRFGLTSAIGSFAGALLGNYTRSPILMLVFGLLLAFVALTHLFGLARWRARGAAAWSAGALSGFFGGLVGNQGGLRSAALLGFDLPRDRFVATATALALVVDAARLPIYLSTQHRALVEMGPLVAIATFGVLAGTLFGATVLRRLAETPFRRTVAILLLIVAISMIVRSVA